MRCLHYVVLFFILPAAAFTEVQFVDATAAAGISFQHVDGRTGEKYLIETLGSGALFFDFDVDGALDLYIVNATHIPPPFAEDSSQTHLPRNTLYRNNGDGTFTDITQKAGVGDTGYGVGCASADIDNDGYPEIYITNYGHNRLYHNNRDGTFTDITQKAGVGDERWGTSCAFLDYDNDGDVDLYVVNYMKFSIEENRWWETRGIRTYCSPTDQIAGSHFVSEPDILYRNNGDSTFTDVTEAAGISHRALGLAVAVGDYDNDGYPDLHIANDMEADLLYRNNGDGTFTETADLTGTGYDGNGFPGSGMGSAFGDYDNNGYLDLVVSNASSLPVVLYQNESAAFFTDVSFTAGIGAVTLPYFKWAVEFFDYNNDGLLDIFVANGHLQENIALFSDSTYPQSDLLFRNTRQRNGTYHFTDASVEIGLAQLPKKVSRGAAFGDYDNDGDIDIFLNNSNQPATLLRNEGGNSNHWLTIQPIGTQSNASGIGTKIIVKAGELSLFKEVRSGASYLSQNDLRLHFGLGENTKVDTLEIHWQSGHKDQFSNLKSNQILRIKEGHGIVDGQSTR
ncbi:CRTAC1 family protein [Candidatus Poribacteria bacterium]|nr:CRTAC1 family protein [Candidatus Poribacteria bacterium]MYH81126.1 CRTAC1 family protein [Candidatus Poribacteria bacterium]